MGLVLDTCILIRAEKKNNHIDFSQWESYGEVYITSITVSELLIGVHRADSEVRRLKRTVFVESIIKAVPVLDFTSEVARIHAEIYASLAAQGQLIGAHDLIIGATALTDGHALLTTNQQEFNRIPGLQILTL